MMPLSRHGFHYGPGSVDGNDKLHLWDLTAQGQIKLEASMCFDRPVTSV